MWKSLVTSVVNYRADVVCYNESNMRLSNGSIDLEVKFPLGPSAATAASTAQSARERIVLNINKLSKHLSVLPVQHVIRHLAYLVEIPNMFD